MVDTPLQENYKTSKKGLQVMALHPPLRQKQP
jgi:hypothetical protein